MNFHGGQHGADHVVDFSVNIPPVNHGAGYEALLLQTARRLSVYPEIDGLTARRALAQALELEEGDIILGSGATDLIYSSARLPHIRRALVVEPTFTEYRRALEGAGVRVDALFSKREDASAEDASAKDARTFYYTLSAKRLAHAVKAGAYDAVYMCNPNNPTGHFLNADFFKCFYEEMAAFEGHHAFTLVIDESFLDFFESGDYDARLRALSREWDVLRIRSLTKTYAVPGLRMGYAVGTERLLKALSEQMSPWALNAYALNSIPYFLQKADYLQALREWCAVERQYMQMRLSELPKIKWCNGVTNFILLEVAPSLADTFQRQLMAHALYVRPCLDFAGLDKRHFRIAIKSRADNALLANTLKEVVYED